MNRIINTQNPAIYASHINAFNRMCTRRKVGISAQLMMFKLLDLFACEGFREWVSVENHALMRAVGCTSETTVMSARSQLQAMGLIEYKRGCKGRPGRYRLLGDPNTSEYVF